VAEVTPEDEARLSLGRTGLAERMSRCTKGFVTSSVTPLCSVDPAPGRSKLSEGRSFAGTGGGAVDAAFERALIQERMPVSLAT
jgi:hypothetical protein